MLAAIVAHEHTWRAFAEGPTAHQEDASRKHFTCSDPQAITASHENCWSYSRLGFARP